MAWENDRDKVHALAIVTTVLFVTWGVACALLIVATSFELQLLRCVQAGDPIGISRARTVEDQQWVLGILYLVVAFLAWLGFTAWCYFACRRAIALEPERMSCQPRHVVISMFFGVLGNFFLYWILRETWRASRAQSSSKRRIPAVSPLVTVHLLALLALFVVGGFFVTPNLGMSYAADFIERRATQPDTFTYLYGEQMSNGIRNAVGSIATYWITVVTCALFIAIVTSITAMQDQKQALFDERADESGEFGETDFLMPAKRSLA